MNNIEQVTEEEFLWRMRGCELGKKWLIWHKTNPAFFDLFERFAMEAINKGHTRLGGWLIANRVRWESAIVTTGCDYKVSNDHIALFTRLFAVRHPNHKHFFKLKTSKRISNDILIDEPEETKETA